MTVCGRSTPSKCSCKSTLGRLCNKSLSSFMGRCFLPAAAVRETTGETLQDNIPPAGIGFSLRYICASCCTIPAQLGLKDFLHDTNHPDVFPDNGLWFAPRDSFPDGDAGTIRL